jgi:hypothetical protein
MSHPAKRRSHVVVNVCRGCGRHWARRYFYYIRNFYCEPLPEVPDMQTVVVPEFATRCCGGDRSN